MLSGCKQRDFAQYAAITPFLRGQAFDPETVEVMGRLS
jgi:hypothetical protein